MAVAFLLYNTMGTAGGSGREHTTPNRCQPGRPENQLKFILLFWFYTQTRLTTFVCFVVFQRRRVKTRNRRVAGISVALQNSRFFPRENAGNLETTKLLEPLGGHVQPGDAPVGLPGPAWGLPAPS